MRWWISGIACAVAAAGPVEFGLSEFNAALASRNLRVKIKYELSLDPPETYRVETYKAGNAHITGGDLRGLMYGLLEAAEQIRAKGKLTQARGVPATPMRGIRIFLHNADLEKSWYYSEDFWRAYFQMLARDRFNRFNLVFAHQTAYLAPPYPFLVDVGAYPEVHVPGLARTQRERNLGMLRYISQTAADYGIDFTLGIWEHNIQPGMQPSVQGLTPGNIGPYSHAALRALLAACPMIRSVQMRTNSESGIPSDQQVRFYRDYVFKALRQAGRRVTLDLRGWVMQPGMLKAAEEAGVPLRLSSKYWCEDLGRPYQPAETWPNYSYINFLEKPRPYDSYWELWGLGSHRLLLWGDPEYVRRSVPTLTLSGSIGFEIDPPLAQKGFGNRPGDWKIPHESRWEFERYWLFYWLWGRLSYDPAAALPSVEHLDEYRAASQVLNQLVAAHLPDPNMYTWPEINPGGLVDAYKDVLPSDWRYIASIPEAVRYRLDHAASAKQTPLETADLLAAAAARLGKTTVIDFQVLAHLARYHAHKQRAAYHLELFYQTADGPSLKLAGQELTQALGVWESLVKITDGVYPAGMAFGPDDTGHWKDKLPYVRHDLETIAHRRKVFEEFGRFAYGFDFGGAVETPRPRSYRRDPYVVGNTVEPRFLPVDPATKFTAALGYGWLTDGDRAAVALPLTPYAEIRATAPNPTHLPSDVLRGDSIRGSGPQIFRVKSGPGEFEVAFVLPGGRARFGQKLAARDGHLDIAFPDADWTVSGLVIRAAAPSGDRAAPVIPPLPKSLPRPQFKHIPPATAAPGRPLALTLQMVPWQDVRTVRLHYRPLNQLAPFQTIEKPAAASITFTIPASDISARWDLLYYFEILNRENAGWFEPDPLVATPYHVVKISHDPAVDRSASVPKTARRK